MTVMSRGRWFVVDALVAAVMLLTRDVRAFCGFYVSGADAKLVNDATQVVLMRDGTRTVLSMQNHYAGPLEDFAMVVPVPVVLSKDQVRTLPNDVFDRIDKLTAPRLVEYWEQDPCPEYEPVVEDMAAAPMRAKGAEGVMGKPAGAVRIEAQYAVGEYDIVILGADDSLALDAWLRENKYKIPEGAEPYLRPYVAAGSKFFVAKVDVKKVKLDADKRALLSPLRFHYDSDLFTLPVRLGLLSSGGTQDLVVMILAKDKRYDVANYPNVTIPTNLDVADGIRKDFGAFYASLFDATLAKHPKAVVTEYAWSSGSCDPCPGPTLSPGDVATLGADALAPPPPPKDAKQLGGIANVWGGAPPSSQFLVTRLHARYTKDALGEDLAFREAPHITGGREGDGQDARPSEYGGSTFQARYAIRHPWTGAVDCANPRFGTWGGPPDGREPKADPAQNTAFAKRNVEYTSFVVGAVDPLGTKGTAPVPPRAKRALLPIPRGVKGAVLIGLLVGAAVALLLGARARRRRAA